MEHEYATALMQLVNKGKTPKRAVAILHEHLLRKGRVALLLRIARACTHLAVREHAKQAVTLFFARKKDTRAKKSAHAALKTLDIAPSATEARVDNTLIGGWRVEGRGKVLDASFKKILLDVYDRAVE